MGRASVQCHSETRGGWGPLKTCTDNARKTCGMQRTLEAERPGDPGIMSSKKIGGPKYGISIDIDNRITFMAWRVCSMGEGRSVG